jgi:hypothetical protein
MGMRIPSAAVVVIVAGVIAASGCGGEDEVPAATQWAGDLCTAVNTWRNSIASATASIASNPSQAGLREAADDAETATQTLVDDIRGLGAPDTESGEQAMETLDDLAGSVESSVATIEDAVDDVSGASGVLEAVSTVSATIATISAELTDSLDEIQGLEDVDDELKQSFEDAPACDGVATSSP